MNGRRDAGSRVRAARDAYKWRFSCEGHTKKKKKKQTNIYILKRRREKNKIKKKSFSVIPPRQGRPWA